MISFQHLNDSYRKHGPNRAARRPKRSARFLAGIVTTLVVLSFAGVAAQWMTPKPKRETRRVARTRIQQPCAGKIVPGVTRGEIEFRGDDGSRWRLDRREKRWEPSN